MRFKSSQMSGVFAGRGRIMYPLPLVFGDFPPSFLPIQKDVRLPKASSALVAQAGLFSFASAPVQLDNFPATCRRLHWSCKLPINCRRVAFFIFHLKNVRLNRIRLALHPKPWGAMPTVGMVFGLSAESQRIKFIPGHSPVRCSRWEGANLVIAK